MIWCLFFSFLINCRCDLADLKIMKIILLFTSLVCFSLIACSEQSDLGNSSQNKAQISDKAPKQEEQKQQAQTKQDLEKQKEAEFALRDGFKIREDDIVLGDRNSKVVLMEYFAPSCPHCAYYHKDVFPILKEKYLNNNKIAYVMREAIGNKADLEAATLARCSKSVDKFLGFVDLLLQQQNSWSNRNYKEKLLSIAQFGGVSEEDYNKCLEDKQLLEMFLRNTKFISDAPKFVGTPAFFINGVQYLKGYSIDYLSKAIDEELQKYSGAVPK